MIESVEEGSLADMHGMMDGDIWCTHTDECYVISGNSSFVYSGPQDDVTIFVVEVIREVLPEQSANNDAEQDALEVADGDDT